jgi:hypothetical protein
MGQTAKQSTVAQVLVVQALVVEAVVQSPSKQTKSTSEWVVQFRHTEGTAETVQAVSVRVPVSDSSTAAMAAAVAVVAESQFKLRFQNTIIKAQFQ